MTELRRVVDKAEAAYLAWAVDHVRRFGDTDVLPIPFEHHIIHQFRDDVVAHLADVNLASHEVRPSMKLLVHKHTCGMRMATQLDPYDQLLYTAMVVQHDRTIERFRQRRGRKIACSYRLERRPDGQLFPRDNGWSTFREQSVALAKMKSKNQLVSADIADFYNQISHHRLQNALEAAGVPRDRSKVIERFLSNISATHHSRGVPVGPTASVLLAELCLGDVDNFLVREGWRHTRYVDDFRIFCNSERKAVLALHDLSEYLYAAHRFTLQDSKTGIKPCDAFLRTSSMSPEQVEAARIKRKTEDLLGSVPRYPDESSEEVEHLTRKQKAHIQRGALRDLMNDVVGAGTLQLGLVRHILRRGTALRTATMIDVVLDNIHVLLPALRDVVNYVVRATRAKHRAKVSERLTWLAKKSDFRDLPYVQYWVIDAVTRMDKVMNSRTAMSIANAADPALRDRLSALIARRYGLADWVRGWKEKWQNTSAWGQRAIVYAGAVLPDDERRHWAKGISNSPDHLTALVARSLLTKMP